MRSFVLLIIAACGTEPASKAKSDPDPKPDTKPDTKPADPFAAWMPANAHELWQGAWLTTMTPDGTNVPTFVAMEITGDKAKMWDPATDKTHELSLELSPCDARFGESFGTKDNGGTHYFDKHYAIDGKVLYAAGLSEVGIRKGKTAIACMGAYTYVLDDKGTCTRWYSSFDKWVGEPSKCSFGDKPVPLAPDGPGYSPGSFVIGDGGDHDQLAIKGDLLTTYLFERARATPDEVPHVHQPDFAAAKLAVKAALQKQHDDHDPLVQAKRSGGVVGDTKTIVSLYATWHGDRATIDGKRISIAGSLSHVTKVDKTWKLSLYQVTKTTTEGKTIQRNWYVNCLSAKEPKGFTDGTSLTITGKVTEQDHELTLVDCTASR